MSVPRVFERIHAFDMKVLFGIFESSFIPPTGLGPAETETTNLGFIANPIAPTSFSCRDILGSSKLSEVQVALQPDNSAMLCFHKKYEHGSLGCTTSIRYRLFSPGWCCRDDGKIVCAYFRGSYHADGSNGRVTIVAFDQAPDPFLWHRVYSKILAINSEHKSAVRRLRKFLGVPEDI